MEKYKKLGGWMMFFVIMLGLASFGILSNIMNIELGFFLSIGGTIGTAGVVIWLGSVIAMVGTVICVVWMVQRKKKSINVFFITRILSIILSLLGYVLISNTAIIKSSQIFTLLLSDIFMGVVWYQYFKKSERVKVYFQEEDSTDFE